MANKKFQGLNLAIAQILTEQKVSAPPAPYGRAPTTIPGRPITMPGRSISTPAERPVLKPYAEPTRTVFGSIPPTVVSGMPVTNAPVATKPKREIITSEQETTQGIVQQAQQSSSTGKSAVEAGTVTSVPPAEPVMPSSVETKPTSTVTSVPRAEPVMPSSVETKPTSTVTSVPRAEPVVPSSDTREKGAFATTDPYGYDYIENIRATRKLPSKTPIADTETETKVATAALPIIPFGLGGAAAAAATAVRNIVSSSSKNQKSAKDEDKKQKEPEYEIEKIDVLKGKLGEFNPGDPSAPINIRRKEREPQEPVGSRFTQFPGYIVPVDQQMNFRAEGKEYNKFIKEDLKKKVSVAINKFLKSKEGKEFKGKLEN
jgi:hypothetical protein